jgi:hypothetical protein
MTRCFCFWLTAGLLAGCSAPSSIGTDETVHRLPAGSIRAMDSRGDPRAAVAWVAADQIAVTTFGSSSCPKRPVKIERENDHRVRVRVRRTERANGCNADLSPTTSNVRLPRGLATDAPLEVVIDDGATRSPHLTVRSPRG